MGEGADVVDVHEIEQVEAAEGEQQCAKERALKRETETPPE